MTSVHIQHIKDNICVELSNGSRQQRSKRKNTILKEVPISIEDLTEEGIRIAPHNAFILSFSREFKLELNFLK